VISIGTDGFIDTQYLNGGFYIEAEDGPELIATNAAEHINYFIQGGIDIPALTFRNRDGYTITINDDGLFATLGDAIEHILGQNEATENKATEEEDDCPDLDELPGLEELYDWR